MLGKEVSASVHSCQSCVFLSRKNVLWIPAVTDFAVRVKFYGFMLFFVCFWTVRWNPKCLCAYFYRSVYSLVRVFILLTVIKRCVLGVIRSVFPVQFRLNVTFLTVFSSFPTSFSSFLRLSMPVNDFQPTNAMSGSGAVSGLVYSRQTAHFCIIQNY